MLNLQNSKKVKGLATGVVLATAAFAASTAANATTLPSSTAEYNFIVENVYKGTATRTLTQSKSNWNYNVKAKVIGVPFASKKSTFKINGSQVIPSSARTTLNLFGMDRTSKLNFSSSGRQVMSSNGNQSKSLAIPDKAFDELSLEAQIRQDLLNNRFTGNYYQVKTGNVEKAKFKKAGNYNLTVPAGTFNTVKVDQVSNGSGNYTTMWLAPSLDYLPVKMVQTSDGKKTEMELTRFSMRS